MRLRRSTAYRSRSTVSVRRGTHVQQIASFYETESEIPKPYSDIFLRLPARRLIGLGGARVLSSKCTVMCGVAEVTWEPGAGSCCDTVAVCIMRFLSPFVRVR